MAGPDVDNDELSIANTEVHYLHSDHVGDEFKLFVGHCGNRDEARPVTVVLGDPDMCFGSAMDIARPMGFHVPPLLFVGIGYRDSAPPSARRIRDFTPGVDPSTSDVPAEMMGGADRFLLFVREELQPWLRERYDVDPDDSAYVGHSLGGLFGVHALLSEPSTFTRYGIGSPSLSWNNYAMFDREESFSHGHDDLPAKVFLSVGAYENAEGTNHLLSWAGLPDEVLAEVQSAGKTDYVGVVARLNDALRGRSYPSLELQFEVLAGEFHHTSTPMHLAHSLRYLFDAPR